MRFSFSSLTTALLLASALPLAAQDAPAEAAPEATTEAPAETQAETPDVVTTEGGLSLDMGSTETAEAAGPRDGDFYIREEFGDWGMRCLYLSEQPDPCELYQLLVGDEGNPVAELTVFPLENAGPAVAGATVIAPLETLLTERVTISVDGGPARQYEFSYCTRAGCIARIGLTQAEVDAFKGGREASLRIVPALDPTQPFDLKVSLSGFTAALNGSSAYDPSAPNE